MRRYVNDYLAHSKAEPAETEITMTLDVVDAAADHVVEVFERYHELLTAEALPSPQFDHDWRAAFTVPWQKPTEGR